MEDGLHVRNRRAQGVEENRGSRRLALLVLLLCACSQKAQPPVIELVCDMPRGGGTSAHEDREADHAHGDRILVPMNPIQRRCVASGKIRVMVTLSPGPGRIHVAGALGGRRFERHIPRGARVEAGSIELAGLAPKVYPLDLRIAEEIQEQPPVTVMPAEP